MYDRAIFLFCVHGAFCGVSRDADRQFSIMIILFLITFFLLKCSSRMRTSRIGDGERLALEREISVLRIDTICLAHFQCAMFGLNKELYSLHSNGTHLPRHFFSSFSIARPEWVSCAKSASDNRNGEVAKWASKLLCCMCCIYSFSIHVL